MRKNKLIVSLLIALIISSAFSGNVIADETDNTKSNAQSEAVSTNQAQTATPESDTSDAAKWRDSDIPSGANMTIAILIIVGYFAILLFFIVMMLVMRKRKKHRIFILLLILWLIAGVVFIIISLVQDSGTPYPVYVEDAKYDPDDFTPYELSEYQNAAIETLGYPTSFIILFEDDMRQETWYYYEDGIIVDFLEGVEIYRGYDEELKEYDVDETDYTPETFVFEMTPGTALDEADIDNFLMEPLDEAMVEDGVLYFAEGIVMGFVDDELYYVETLLVED